MSAGIRIHRIKDVLEVLQQSWGLPVVTAHDFRSYPSLLVEYECRRDADNAPASRHISTQIEERDEICLISRQPFCRGVPGFVKRHRQYHDTPLIEGAFCGSQ